LQPDHVGYRKSFLRVSKRHLVEPEIKSLGADIATSAFLQPALRPALARNRQSKVAQGAEGFFMGIDKESDVQANLQIGPTSLGMVRIYVEGDGIEIPMDFDPEEADEIAEELKAAANQARNMGGKAKKGRKSRSK